jgi:hypothetical protein
MGNEAREKTFNEAQLAAAKAEAHDAGEVEGFARGVAAAIGVIEGRWASPISAQIAESMRELLPVVATEGEKQ